MAWIQCSYCGREIEHDATKCWCCGRQLNPLVPLASARNADLGFAHAGVGGVVRSTARRQPLGSSTSKLPLVFVVLAGLGAGLYFQSVEQAIAAVVNSVMVIACWYWRH